MEATTNFEKDMTVLPDAVAELLDPASDKPVAIVRRQDDDVAVVLTGTVGSVALLAEIPLDGPDVLAAARAADGAVLAVAEEARYQSAPDDASLRVLALLDARMDEVYAAHYEFNSGLWEQHEGYSLIRPENLVLPAGWQGADWLLAGNAFASYAERLPFAAPVRRIQALPTATAMLRLAPALLAAGQAVRADEALPTYIRDKVAQTTQERADQKAAQQA